MAHIDTAEKISRKISVGFLTFGIFGNLLIIVYFCNKNRKNISKTSLYHFLIIKLAIADLLFCLWSLLFHVNDLFPMFEISRRTFFYILFPLDHSSIWILLQISYSRYKSIVHPLHPRCSKRRFTLLTFSVAFLSLVSSLIRMHFELPFSADLKKIILITLCMVIPSIAMFFFYHRSSKKLRSENAADVMNVYVRMRNKNALNTLKLLLTIYFFSVFLSRILDLAFSYFEHSSVTFLSIFRIVSTYVIYPQNNILNIIVYATVMKDFRLFLKKILWLQSRK